MIVNLERPTPGIHYPPQSLSPERCPCKCESGWKSERDEKGECKCDCTCEDGTKDKIDKNGKCPCKCSCQNCKDSVRKAIGCYCPNDNQKCSEPGAVGRWVDCKFDRWVDRMLLLRLSSLPSINASPLAFATRSSRPA